MTLADVTALVELLGRLGRTPSPEAGAQAGFTELDHGLQCAYELLLRRPGDPELHVAGLVHDIGHQFGDDESHGRLGGEAVRDLLGDRVAALMIGHVPAKRHLVTVDPEYIASLSAVSRETLLRQGGPMASAEVAAFRGSPHWEDAVYLRRADDAAKVPGRRVPRLDHWLPVIDRLARPAT